MTFSRSTSAGYLAKHMARLFARGLQDRIKPLGLTVGTFPALLELWEKDGQSQSQLVRALDIEQATMANTLARMERDGLVIRKKDPADSRAQKVWLTARSKALQGPATAAALDQNALAMSGLSDTERAQFLKLMGKAISAMQSPAGSRPAPPDANSAARLKNI
jgi:DNA-binding MarR family transcriptional regulator